MRDGRSAARTCVTRLLTFVALAVIFVAALFLASTPWGRVLLIVILVVGGLLGGGAYYLWW